MAGIRQIAGKRAISVASLSASGRCRRTNRSWYGLHGSDRDRIPGKDSRGEPPFGSPQSQVLYILDFSAIKASNVSLSFLLG
jgi:hypothetical protein